MLFNPLFFHFLRTLLLAIFCGTVLGFDRQIKNKPAGMKTVALICMGATLFGWLSHLISGQYVDASRVDAGVANGIGLLAAGTIIVQKDRVIGLTTASVSWIACAIGLLLGAEQITLALLGTFMAVCAVQALGFIEDKIKPYHKK